MANTYLTRTAGSTGNRKTFTFSAWIKRSRISNADATQMLFGTYTDTNNRFDIGFHNANNFVVKEKQSSTNIDFTTSRLLRDPSAWLNLVVAVDTTQSTESNRLKIYVNGVQETSFIDSNYPDQNYDTLANVSGRTYVIGQEGNNQYYFDGSMSHVHFVDGTAYPASTFGSTDSVTGEWKINTSPSITMGTNGFTILKDGNTITDQSSNSNNFSLGGGTLTNTEDCPSNVFCTLNPLYNQTTGQGVVLSYGNNKSYYASNSNRSAFGTIAISSGKYYFEAKNASAEQNMMVGIGDVEWSDINGASGYGAYDNPFSVLYYASGGNKYVNTSNTSYGDSYTNGDIVGIAIDLDNNFAYFSKNGVWQNSGVPTSGSTGTGGIAITTGKSYVPSVRMRNGTSIELNFGNGYFGTTAISSEGTNASGIGKFEYDVPAGFTALSTKGLNE